MGNALAPHLKHASAEGAWFDPLALIATFPATMSEAVETERLAYWHENVHFWQAITTFFGAYRFHAMWESLSDFYKLLKTTDLSPLHKQRFLEKHQDKLLALEDLALPSSFDKEISIKPGIHCIEEQGRFFGVYAKPLETGVVRLFPLGADALQESMAMAIERWYGFSEDTYQLARDSLNFAHFKYAVGTESLRTITGWDDKTLWWVTVVLCDIALDHFPPHLTFYLGIRYVATKYASQPPSLQYLTDFYLDIQREVRDDEVEKEKQQLQRNLSRIITRSQTSADRFDQVFTQLLKLVNDGLELRKNHPTVVVEHLLSLSNKETHHDLLDRFYLPCYRVNEHLLTTRFEKDQDLTNAILLLTSQIHYLKCFIGESEEQQCPFYETKNCDFEKIEICQKAPWQRPEVNKEACIYRFAIHVLGYRPDIT